MVSHRGTIFLCYSYLMKVSNLKDKKMLILGFGVEGKDTFSFLKKRFPDQRIGIADKNESIEVEGVELHLGEDYLSAVEEYDVIFKTPGIPLEDVPLLDNQELTSHTKFFFQNCPSTIVGVTGTKGKGTTASLINFVLDKKGRDSYLVGNIGQPPLGLLDKAKEDTIFVYELSARQLRDIDRGPDIAVFLNLYRAHQDYYSSMESYKKAKSRIALLQDEEDYFVFNEDDEFVSSLSRRTEAQVIPFGPSNLNSQLPGDYNRYNIGAAVEVLRLLGIEDFSDEIGGFKGLPHRMEFVGEFQGISFYNDSLATIPASTIKGIETLDLGTLILGGHEAGQDFDELIDHVHDVDHIVLFPPVGERIEKKLKEIEYESFSNASSMKEAVDICFEETEKGKAALLSPAAPSFGLFKNYKDRGEQFKRYVHEV